MDTNRSLKSALHCKSSSAGNNIRSSACMSTFQSPEYIPVSLTCYLSFVNIC